MTKCVRMCVLRVLAFSFPYGEMSLMCNRATAATS